MGTAALIRTALADAQIYLRKWQEWERTDKKDPSKQPARDLKLEALTRALRGEVPALFIANREDDISTAIRKDADVLLFDGDPFEYTSHVESVLVNGQISYRRR